MARSARPSKPKRIDLYSDTDYQRQIPISDDPDDRSPFRRDFSRLLHSPAFRRLQGKAQLFPGSDDDFFRNRLTHSLEVAQIGKSIANILNTQVYHAPAMQLDVYLVEFACLAHDLGHPPFGHVGEAALDECMKEFGGFEGNAQTSEILCRLEKKELRGGHDAVGWQPARRGNDARAGLNATYRAMASVLKYDHQIPSVRGKDDILVKGYYYFDARIVVEMRQKVLGTCAEQDAPLRTVECSIMDTADDIAYSTYDLEDVYKSGLHTPIGLWLLTNDIALMRQIAHKVHEKIEKFYGRQDIEFTAAEAREIMRNFFLPWLQTDSARDFDAAFVMARASHSVARDGYARSEFTSGLIARALSNLELVPSGVHPALDTVRLSLPKFKEIEVLKGLNFAAVIE